MDIKEQLKREISKINTKYIANYIGNDPELFKELMDLIFEEKDPLPLRASWVASVLSDTYPDLLHSYINKVIAQLKNFKHPGIRRNFLRALANLDIPEQYTGIIYDDCYQWLLSKEEPPAVKVYSMQILFNIAKNEPDLLRELRLVLEGLTDHESAGIRSRTNELLKKIHQLSVSVRKTNP
jgi:hypothetical protein